MQSAGSNKALEFLNAGSIDFGSTAGSAALVAKINGNPIKSIYVYSRPGWTALVTGKDSKIAKVADLKGKRVAVTRGTDPHIFLVRALLDAGLTDKDITPLQRPCGRCLMLALDHVGKTYPNGVHALENFSARIAPGEIVAIIGGSGCGKSTLLRAISGLDSATTGSVILDTIAVTAPREKIGVIFQEPRLLPWLSVADNIGFGLGNLPSAERQQRVARALARVGLTDKAGAWPRELSGAGLAGSLAQSQGRPADDLPTVGEGI